MFRGEIGPIQWVCIKCSEYIFRDKATSLTCGFSPGFCPVEHTIQGWDGHHDHPMDPLVARRSPWPMGLHEVFWPNAKVFGRFKIQLHQLICPTTNTAVKPRDQASSFWGARAANHGGFQGQGQYLCASLAPVTRISICTPKASFWGTEVCSLWAWDLSIDRLSHAGRLYTWEKVLGRKRALDCCSSRGEPLEGTSCWEVEPEGETTKSWRVGGMSFCLEPWLSSRSEGMSGTHGVVCSPYTETWCAPSFRAREFALQHLEELPCIPPRLALIPFQTIALWFHLYHLKEHLLDSSIPLTFIPGSAPLFFFVTRTNLFTLLLVFFLLQHLCSLCLWCTGNSSWYWAIFSGIALPIASLSFCRGAFRCTPCP